MELKSVTKKLARIPIPSRELFLVVVNRGKDERFGAALEVSVSEIQQATKLSTSELRECFSILDSNGFTFDNDTNDLGVQMVGVASPTSGWPLWADIKSFCKKEEIEVAQLVINLDFSVLDEG